MSAAAVTSAVERRRERQRERYHARMAQVREYLGGRCVCCGSREDLEIDHADPRQKRAALTTLWSHGPAFWMELQVCQLLCHDCHRSKTYVERSQRVEIARARALYIASLERAPFEDWMPAANDTAANDDCNALARPA